MSDFLSQQQCDELVNGQTYNGEYVPTDQDLADMAEAWGNDDYYEETEADTYQDHSYYDDFDQPEWME